MRNHNAKESQQKTLPSNAENSSTINDDGVEITFKDLFQIVACQMPMSIHVHKKREE